MTGDLVGEDLACRRGGRLVFTGLDCRLPAGGALVLTGPNGSGKSSLLRLLAGLLPPAGGRLLWGGVPVDAPAGGDRTPYRNAIHYAGHLDALKAALSARETLDFWAALRGVASPPIAAALARFGLAHAADWPCAWLSAGQRRRLALARLIAAPAPVWLLDEPAAALDADGEARLVGAIAEHRAAGGGVVVATHQPIALPGAAAIVLDEFAPAPGDAMAAAW